MQSPIKIGFYNETRKLKSIDLSEDFSWIESSSKLDQWNEVLKCFQNDLFDACVVELKIIPYDKKFISIAALIQSETSHYNLVIKNEKVCNDCDMRLMKGSSVGVMTPYVKSQVEFLNGSLQCSVVPVEEYKNKNIIEAYDAWVVGAEFLSLFDTQKMRIFPVHPTEIWPETGSGVWALVTPAESKDVFKKLRTLHQFSISDVHNPSRKLCQLAQLKGVSDVQAFCQRDSAGNYHMYAARYDENFQRHRISQSTHDQLAERMSAALNL